MNTSQASDTAISSAMANTPMATGLFRNPHGSGSGFASPNGGVQIKRTRPASTPPGAGAGAPTGANTAITMHNMSPEHGEGDKPKLRKIELSDTPVTVDFSAGQKVNTKTSMAGRLGQDAQPAEKVDELRQQCITAHTESQQNFAWLDGRAQTLEQEVTKLAM